MLEQSELAAITDKSIEQTNANPIDVDGMEVE